MCIIKLSPTTTGLIQSTSKASDIRKSFLATLTKLHNLFEKTSNNEIECAQVIKNIQGQLAGEELDESAEIATIAVDSLQQFEETLRKKLRSQFVFYDKFTKIIHIVRIIEVQQNEVICEESTKIIDNNGNKMFAIGLTENARDNYRGMQINLPPIKREVIKKRNIQLLKTEEMRDFYRTRVLPVIIEQEFLNPVSHKESFFEDYLPMVVRGLWRCEFKISCRKRNEIERVTLKISFNPNIKQGNLIETMKTTIESRLT